MWVERDVKICDAEIMTTNNPFGPSGAFNDLFKREREQAEVIRRALGPGYELQLRMKELEGPLAHFKELQRGGALSSLFGTASFHAESMKQLQALATPSWMQALQSTAIGIGRDELGILKTQRLLAGSIDSDVLRLARTLEDNQSIIKSLMKASRWTEQFKSLSERLAPNLLGIKAAAERAQMLDLMTLRASADVVAKSAVAIATEQVLEAHRLIVAIGQTDSPEQGASLFAALLRVIAAIFSRFGENTINELRNIGAIKIIELLAVALAFMPLVVTPDMSPAEKKVVAEMKAEVETLQEKFDKIQAANMAANEAYVADLPRAELKRAAPIRRDGDAKAIILLKGPQGMLLAVKQSKDRWCQVVYRDPLTDQLAQGWVYAGAVQLLDDPAK